MRSQVGPFELDCVLGRGGMAVVWEARHVDQNVPVAVKIMTDELARRERHREAFFEEVRSVARLHHPGIVMVLDVGEVDEAAAHRLMLPPGCPFLAMELVRPGALPKAALPRDWPTTYRIATQLFDAMAHAHARGVIHRDIKGDNILVDGGPDGWQLKLTDFGLARYIDDGSSALEREARTSGTPRYMAPEQVLGEVWRQGPWTDLYSAGCVIWWLVCGAPPFTGSDNSEVMRAHVSHSLPALQPTFEIPTGLEGWLRRLLAKKPTARFRRAADAAWALHRLVGSFEWAIGSAGVPPPEVADTVVDDTVIAKPPLPSSVTLGEIAVHDAVELGGEGDATQSDAPPIPLTWRRPKAPLPPPRLLGAGLGLYGLRTVPMVDRESERDALWGALREVCLAGVTRLVILRGPAGTGKSRVAEWIAERAHELGAATVLRAVHSRNGGPLDGLAPMFARHLRCAGLDFDATFERVIEDFQMRGVSWEPSFFYDAKTIARFIARDSVPGGGADERDAACASFVRTLAAQRPVVLSIDDAQWADEALRLVDSLAGRPDAPVLVILTIREGDVRPAVQRRLDVWGASGVDVAIGPLDAIDHQTLVQELLGLDDDLAKSVADRTAGNPLFAAQLVGDWVERGALVVGDVGFELHESAPDRLPANVLEVAIGRVHRALSRVQGDPDEVLVATKLAAILGHTVDRDEWMAARKVAAVAPDAQIETALATAGLIRVDAGGFAFVHAVVTESLVELARTSGEWARLNRACADALDELSKTAGAPRMARRRAHHRERAGEFVAAVDRWLEHATGLAEFGRYDEARSILEHRDALLRDLEVASDDRRWVESTLLQASIDGNLGDTEAAVARTSTVEAAARAAGWDDLLGRALSMRSVHGLMCGRLSDAERHARAACDAYRGTDEGAHFSRAEYNLGLAIQYQGRTAEAAEHFEAARRRLVEIGDDNLTAAALTGLGEVAVMEGRLDDAEDHFAEAARLAKSIGSRQREASVALQGGDVARLRGALADARALYARAESLWRSTGNANADIASLKLIWVRFDGGDFDAADRLEELIEAFQARGRWYVVRFAQLGIAVCAAHAGDSERFDDAFSRALSDIEASGDRHFELAVLAERAEGLARRSGWPRRAQRARSLARELRDDWVND